MQKYQVVVSQLIITYHSLGYANENYTFFGWFYFYDSVSPWSRSCLDKLVFIYDSPTVVGVEKQFFLKRWRRTKLRWWSYLYIEVVCLTFFCNIKNTLFKLKNTFQGDLRAVWASYLMLAYYYPQGKQWDRRRQLQNLGGARQAAERCMERGLPWRRGLSVYP